MPEVNPLASTNLDRAAGAVAAADPASTQAMLQEFGRINANPMAVMAKEERARLMQLYQQLKAKGLTTDQIIGQV